MRLFEPVKESRPARYSRHGHSFPWEQGLSEGSLHGAALASYSCNDYHDQFTIYSQIETFTTKKKRYCHTSWHAQQSRVQTTLRCVCLALIPLWQFDEYYMADQAHPRTNPESLRTDVRCTASVANGPSTLHRMK